MSNNKYNDYSSGIKKSVSSYTIKQSSYKKSKQVNNDDILTKRVKDNVKQRTINYSKGFAIKIVKSPYSIVKGVYKLDKAVDSYFSKPTKVLYNNSKVYAVKNSAYNKAKNNFLDRKYTSTKATFIGDIASLNNKNKIYINKYNYKNIKTKFAKMSFKDNINYTSKRNNRKLNSTFAYKGTLRFENKRPIDWNKAKIQRKIEDIGRYLGKNKELKLRNIRDNNLNKWISKKYRFRERLRGNIKNKALYPYKNTKSTFKETFKKVREGEDEVAREATEKIVKQGKKAIGLGKYFLKRIDRKIKFTKYQRVKAKKLEEKIKRVNSINRFKKKNINKMNAGRFSGKDRFFKKRKALKKFKKDNRYLLRQRLFDRILFGIKDFFNSLKNPIKLFETIFRMIGSVKTLLLIAIPLVIIAGVFSSIGMQAKENAVNEDIILIEQDAIFASYHSKYNYENFLNEVKNKYRGYDKYEIDVGEVGYNNYEILAYLNIAYGNIEENKDEFMALIREDLKEVFDTLYYEDAEETTETKIEYEYHLKEDGTYEEVPVEKIYRYIKVTVKKRDNLKNILLKRLYLRKQDNWFFNEEIKDDEIDEWFEALVKNKLGAENLFATSLNAGVAINGVINRGSFSSENSVFGEPKLNNIDPNGYGYAFGQCTWYAFQRRSEIGKPMPHSFFGDGGSWWITAKKEGMSVDHSPRPGDVASFPAGVAGAYPPWGHVAFVEKVNEDGSIEVSEMNGGNTVDGVIRYRHIPKEAIPYTYFIH